MDMKDDMYWQSFNRNYVGLISKEEQQRLRDSCVAVAGVGGIGGNQAAALARLGIGKMKIADIEEYSYSDINRMYGAFSSTVGKAKVRVMEDFLKDINPGLELEVFEEGITLDNPEEFLDGADVAIDAIEYFTLEEKLRYNQVAREKGLYVLTSPIPAYGTSMLVFSPEGMTFEEYLEIPDTAEERKSYVMPPSKICPKLPDYLSEEVYGDKAMKKEIALSTVGSSAMLSGAIVANEALMMLLSKRDPVVVPEITLLDMCERRFEIVNGLEGCLQ